MKRKDYQKPTMTVVELRHRTQLLTGSTEMRATRDSYGTANSEVETDDLNDGEWEWD